MVVQLADRLPEMLAMLFFTLWGVALIFHTRSKRVVLAASILLLVAMLQFVFCCYPRFQIPLVYIGGSCCLRLGARVCW